MYISWWLGRGGREGRLPAWEGREKEGGAGALKEGRTREDHGSLEDNELRLEEDKLRDDSVLDETKPVLRVLRDTSTSYIHR